MSLALAFGLAASAAAAQVPEFDAPSGPESFPQFDAFPELDALPVEPDSDGAPAAEPDSTQSLAERAEELLDQLAVAEDEAESKRLERMILDAWHRSGSDTVDLLLQRAAVAIQEKEYALALELLDTIVELAPDFPEGWNKRATVYYMINEYTRSLADIGRVLALQPRHFGALSGLGMIFQELDNDERALSAFRRANEVHPHLADIDRAIERLTIEVEGRGI